MPTLSQYQRSCYGTGKRGLIGSLPYDSTSDEILAYFIEDRLAVLVAPENGDPVIVSLDRKLGSRSEYPVVRHLDIIGPRDPYSDLVFVQGAD